MFFNKKKATAEMTTALLCRSNISKNTFKTVAEYLEDDEIRHILGVCISTLDSRDVSQDKVLAKMIDKAVSNPDSFDALDEAWSQWLDALRANRTKEYIPESLIPRDTTNGKPIRPNSFDNRFIAIGDDMSERGMNKVQTEQSQIPHESYLATYITALDLCLQGIVSPSTLGIDVKKMDNAEAQREKEKTTLYTRGNLVKFIDGVMQKLVVSALAGYHIWHNEGFDGNLKCTVKFGEYANPSFEAVVETVSKAKTAGIMSVEACVEEMYGDSKEQSWKDEEIARLKVEQGVITPDDDGITTALGDFSVMTDG